MQIAILHHHLNRGGVTSVIANHLRSLATLPEAERPERVVVFYDGQQDGWPSDLPRELSIAMVDEPALAYDAAGASAEPEELADLLSDRFEACGLQPGDTLLHVHNHSLGKNASLPRALEHLAGDGWRMLLQIHDFAEDNRPENYRHLREAIGVADPDELGEILYPQAPGIHYATLTERDADILRQAGFAEERLHTLPNPVHEFGEMPSQEEAKRRVFPALGLPDDARLIVYPVRGIRRKNLGEMLLLSVVAPAGTYFAVTLRPKNPVEALSFDRWKRVAETLGLPCLFDTGGSKEEGGYGCDFKATLAAADAVLTTSVAEGFGMVFLEAWLAGKPLVGRDLPEITREFKRAGMNFGPMYHGYRTANGPSALDFGQSTAARQLAHIKDYLRDPGEPEASTVPWSLLPVEQIEANAEVVRNHYSIGKLAERLQTVYQSCWQKAGPASGAVSGGQIVNHFADPRRQFPVRTEAMNPLAQTITSLSSPLEAQPTNEQASLPRLTGIRAVVFDVYGTLLVSGSGDISLASEGSRGSAALEALKAVLGEPKTPVVGGPPVPASTPTTGVDGSLPDGDAIVAALHEAVHAAHAASASGHPEVEIRELWKKVLTSFGVDLAEAQIERFAVEYECRVNPIWPMPGLAETLNGLHETGKQLGIVSNAQFFTPLAFEPLTGRPLDAWGFDDPQLNIWSYEHREAKPGTFLYERCAEGLTARGIQPAEALFVGNDLRNDVWPAQRVGFKTALFAGDARSLRWRQDDPLVAGVRPEAVITQLRQLLEIVE